MTTLSKSRRCLFGGTILAAGIAAQPAQAQTFDLAYVNTDLREFYGAYDYTIDGGPWDLSITSRGYGNDNAASSWGQPTTIGTSADAPSAFYAWGRINPSCFYVTEDGTATASWDFSADSYGNSYLWVYDGAGSSLLSVTWGDAPGSVDIPLSAGTAYYVRCVSFADNGGGTSFSQLTIPAPGPAAILAVAGLLATRRRRE